MQLNIERILRDASEIKRDSFDLYIMQRFTLIVISYTRYIFWKDHPRMRHTYHTSNFK